MHETTTHRSARTSGPISFCYRSPVPYEVRQEDIHEFARTVQDFHPAHWSPDAAAEFGFAGLVAPATFTSVILARAQREILDTMITGCDPTRILHADQVFDFGRPLIAGDRLTCDISVESFREFDDYAVIAIKSVLTDQHETIVQNGSTALLARVRDTDLWTATARHRPTGDRPPAGPRARAVPTAADRRVPRVVDRSPRTVLALEDLAVGDELPTRTVFLPGAQPAGYGARPHRSAGSRAVTAGRVFPDTPGMLKLGLATSVLTSWLGDPGAVRRVRAQFAHNTHYLRLPSHAPREIDFHGRVTAIDARRRRATVTIDARADGRKLFGYAAAEVRFPPRLPVATG